MQDLQAQYKELSNEVATAVKQLQMDQLEKELEELTTKSHQADFWNNNQNAQTIVKRISSLEERVKPWRELSQSLSDIEELIQTNDNSLKGELDSQLKSLTQDFNELKGQLKLSGQYDEYDSIVSIHAGAGGTDAQDWAQMLYRMYNRWTEAQGFKLAVVEESAGEEAGLKSITFNVCGDFAYGKLKGEHGVHRLVRLSPFNADNLRQTSFAKVEILPKIDKPTDVQIDEKDLKVDVYRSGGHGGQSVNTTDSAVRLTHVPTGIVVAIQNERSQLQNKETAMTILRSKLAQLRLEQHKENLRDLKGPNEQAAWGNQIRNYVLHPYKQVKDLRTKFETSDAEGVLNGNLNSFIDAYLEHTLSAS